MNYTTFGMTSGFEVGKSKGKGQNYSMSVHYKIANSYMSDTVGHNAKQVTSSKYGLQGRTPLTLQPQASLAPSTVDERGNSPVQHAGTVQPMPSTTTKVTSGH